MDENYFKDKISGYFDGDLKPDEMEMMREWLENSEAGRKALEEFRKLDEFSREHSELAGGEDFWEAQAQKIEARLGFETEQPDNVTPIAKSPSRGLTWKLIAGAASIALIAYIGLNEWEVFGPEDMIEPTPAAEQAPRVVTPADDRADEDIAPPSEDEEFRQELGQARESQAQPEFKVQAEAEATKEQPEQYQRTTPDRAAKPAGEGASEPHDLKDQTADPMTSSPAPVEPDEAVTDQPRARRAQPSSQREQNVGSELATLEAEAAVDSMLPVWRKTYAQTDSILAVLASTKEPKKKSEFDAVQKLTEQSGRHNLSGETAPNNRTEMEAKLLEACFQVARLTPDSTEKAGMKARLESFAADAKSPHQQLARDYLGRLK